MLDRPYRAIAAAVLLAMTGPALADTECRLREPSGTITVSAGRSSDRVEGSGQVTEERRSLSGFSSLRVSGPFDIDLRAASSEGVTVRADDNVLPLIETRVADNALEIQPRRGASFRTRVRPRVTVEFVRMDAISLAGSGDLVADRIRADTFAVSISGSNDMCVRSLEAGTFGLSIAGSGDFRASGRADTQGIRIAGSGDAMLHDLVGKVVKISIAGSGDVSVHATDELEVQIAGSGDVTYRGDPKIRRSLAGSGEIRRMRD